ncbi:MAG TPA: Smr/MutS family protein [Bacteroidales bacterium]|nr:Smr/MutS family protein [Bacteroidales bacterium]
MTGSSGNSIKEVDLHLKEGYSQSDAIERQIERFRGELDSAVRTGRKEIIFIHGIGSGKLKQELRRIISTYYTSCSYQDASFNRYGFGGATLVTIRKIKPDGIR